MKETGTITKINQTGQYPTKDRETNKFTTGKVVEIFAIDKEGKKKFIGVKTYRGKGGPDSKTSTTTQWSHNMQKCFDGGKS